MNLVVVILEEFFAASFANSVTLNCDTLSKKTVLTKFIANISPGTGVKTQNDSTAEPLVSDHPQRRWFLIHNKKYGNNGKQDFSAKFI
jgi:hypothetical protein